MLGLVSGELYQHAQHEDGLRRAATAAGDMRETEPHAQILRPRHGLHQVSQHTDCGFFPRYF